MARMEGKVAIVTGAAGGIGEATARLFAAEGARVVITDVQADKGEAVARDIGANACFMRQDVSKADDWARVIAETEKRFGPISALVNNAGIGQTTTPIMECSEETYRRFIDINQVSVFLGMKAVVPSMQKCGGGSIVNISSAAGLVAVPGSIAYGAAKFAVTGMSKIAALDLGAFGIRVNSVHPGAIETPMMAQGVSPALTAQLHAFAKSLPAGRMGRPSEMAEMILFLASDAASYCTGGAFSADGGWTTS